MAAKLDLTAEDLTQIANLKEAQRLAFDEKKYLAEQHLLSFTRQAWTAIDTTPFINNWHLRLICDYLMAVSIGIIKRLIINIPPGYTKSMMVSIMWPCWEWATINPGQKWVFCSYAALLSSYMSIKRRDLISSEWYQNNWNLPLKADYNRQADFMNDVGGMMFSSSTGGALTGMGGNRLVIDDPTNPQEAISDAAREGVNDWFYNTFLSRLRDMKNGTITLIQQRLNQNDLTGFLTGIDNSELDGYLHEGNGWTLVRVPLISEQTEEIISPLTGELIHEYREGELLWPEREGLAQIEEKRRDPYVFEAQYQQRPSSKFGAIFQRDWLDGHYYEGRIPVNPDTWILSVDTTFKNSVSADYVCMGVWGWKAPNMYLDHVVREKLSYTQSVDTIKQLLAMYPSISAKVIEETANGAAIIDTLQRDIGGIIAIHPGESKVARAQAVTPYFRSGNVYVRNAPWTHEYVRELVNFDGSSSTKTKKDDQVDMTTQAVTYMQRTFGGLIEHDGEPQIGIARFISTGRSRRRY